MAVVALPAAFAVAGGLASMGIGGTFMVGASVGWMVGAWLFGPKATYDNQIFDPGAQEMPRFNQSLRGVTVPILFGTNRVSSNVVWTKNFQTIRNETVTSRSAGGGGSGGGSPPPQVEISYEYKWDVLLSLGMSGVRMGLFTGWTNSARIKPASILSIVEGFANAETDALALAGGMHPASAANQGDIAFDQAFYGPGDPTGSPDNSWAYFAAQEGVSTNWPRMISVGFKALNLGSSGQLPQFSWEIGPVDDAEVDENGDVRPSYIIYQILTNTVYGLSIPASSIDTDTYNTVQTFCDNENIRVSVQYLREESVLGVIEDLLSLYGGYLVVSGGIIKFGVVTADSTPVRTIDNHHLVVEEVGTPPVTITRGAPQDGFNKVRVNYFDRALDYRQNQVEVGDEVDQDINGVRLKEFPPKYVMSENTGLKIADRALWNNLYARERYAFKLGWKDADLEPGDVITLVDSFHPELSTGRKVRITTWRERRRGVFEVQAFLEVPQYLTDPASLTVSNSGSAARGLFDPPQPPLRTVAYEVDRQLQTDGPVMHVGYNQNSTIKGAILYTSDDDVTYVPKQQGEPFPISGIIASPLAERWPGYVEENVEIYLMPASGHSPSTPTYVQTVSLDDVAELQRANAGGIIVVNSETMAIEGISLLAQNHYRVSRLYRGYAGSRVIEHSSGSYFHRHAGGIFTLPITTKQIGSAVYYKVVPYNFAGEVYDVSSVQSTRYVVQGRYWRPENPAYIRTFVQSAVSWPAAVSLDDKYSVLVTSGGCDATFEWSDASIVSGLGTKGWGIDPFGDFNQDADEHYWRVEIGRRINTGDIVFTAVDTFFSGQNFNAVAWSPALAQFASVADAPTGLGIHASVNGRDWTPSSVTIDGFNWRGVAWAPELAAFVAVSPQGMAAVSNSGTVWTVNSGPRIAIAPSTNFLDLADVAWSSDLELFASVATAGSGRLITSPDGVTWTVRSINRDREYYGVAWSSALSLFAIVGGDTVLTSPDGLAWTERTPALNRRWRSIAWSPALSLFAAVADTGTGQRVMTSPDGTTWTARSTPSDSAWRSITWSPDLGLFAAVAGDTVMVSSNGTDWIGVDVPAGIWKGIAWSPALGIFAAVANTDANNRRIITSVASSFYIVRSTTTTTPAYTYDRASHSADFTGFNNPFILRVTARNQFGDSPRTIVRSLDLHY